MTVEVTHADILEALSRGSERFDKIEAMVNEQSSVIQKNAERAEEVAEVTRSMAETLEALPQMQADIAETKELVEAWDTVKNAGRFIKWVSGIVVAITAIVVAFKTGVAHVFR